MKFGIRTPNLSKSIKAKTIGRAKRTMKKAVNPIYGKKGMGYINNPKKAIYNNVYNKTTVGLSNMLKSNSCNKSDINEVLHKNWERKDNEIYFNNKLYSKKELKRLGKITLITSVFLILCGLYMIPIGIIFLILGIIYLSLACKELKESKK